MRKKTLDHHMGYFQYLNTTIYGKKGLLLFETLSIQGALLVADPISKPSADFVLGAPAARHFSRRQQPTQTGIAADE